VLQVLAARNPTRLRMHPVQEGATKSLVIVDNALKYEAFVDMMMTESEREVEG
jgi:hypothetical protein